MDGTCEDRQECGSLAVTEASEGRRVAQTRVVLPLSACRSCSRPATSHTHESARTYLDAPFTLQNVGRCGRNRLHRHCHSPVRGRCRQCHTRGRLPDGHGSVPLRRRRRKAGRCRLDLTGRLPPVVLRPRHRRGAAGSGTDGRRGLQVPGLTCRIHHRGTQLVHLGSADPRRPRHGLSRRRRPPRRRRREADLAEAHGEDAGLLRADRPVRRRRHLRGWVGRGSRARALPARQRRHALPPDRGLERRGQVVHPRAAELPHAPPPPPPTRQPQQPAPPPPPPLPPPPPPRPPPPAPPPANQTPPPATATTPPPTSSPPPTTPDVP